MSISLALDNSDSQAEVQINAPLLLQQFSVGKANWGWSKIHVKIQLLMSRGHACLNGKTAHQIDRRKNSEITNSVVIGSYT
ncbi:hypothetical protein DP116_20440 [Brasilonema bromeliae SPC951]|uniref:Uncharacterized protein n=1 Tax=Brasilonema bromeliae SPC951 TaxID=385972 RepID=A0ABX1PBB9_9CYAN|nr:hypothetical protein [Brasilonema bromeliae SPC951]